MRRRRHLRCQNNLYQLKLADTVSGGMLNLTHSLKLAKYLGPVATVVSWQCEGGK